MRGSSSAMTKSNTSTSLLRGDPPPADDELPDVDDPRLVALTRFQRLHVPNFGTASAAGAQLPVGDDWREDWREVVADFGSKTTRAGCKPTCRGCLTGIALAFASGTTGHCATEPDFGVVHADAAAEPGFGVAAAEDGGGDTQADGDCAGGGGTQPGGARCGRGGGIQLGGAPGGGGGGADMRVARSNACAASTTLASSAAAERGVRMTATLPRGDCMGDVGLLCTAGIAGNEANDRGFRRRAAVK